jgi:hypothetical protein
LFNKNSRKKFQEQNWLKIIETDKNPSQAYRRFRDEALQAISDLSLLASRLPDDKLYEIFNEHTLGPLFTSIFFVDKSKDIFKLRQPNVQLASFLVDQGITHCLSEYEKWNKDTPKSSKPTIEYLQRAASICKEIGYKYLRDYIDNKIVAKKNRLICIWENKFDRDFDRFEKYIYQEMTNLEGFPISIESVKMDKTNEFRFIVWEEGPSEEKAFGGVIKIEFSLNKQYDDMLNDNDGKITFYDHHHKEIKSKRIRILKFGSEHALIED